jgi:hypothetical protein
MVGVTGSIPVVPTNRIIGKLAVKKIGEHIAA